MELPWVDIIAIFHQFMLMIPYLAPISIKEQCSILIRYYAGHPKINGGEKVSHRRTSIVKINPIATIISLWVITGRTQ